MGAELPSGLVTFVFTDIEGSTRLFRRLADGYPPLLERHNAILRDQWSRHRGVEVKTDGDSFLVAFASAADAFAASVGAQRALSMEAWPSGATVRVRMGIHAGIAYPRGNDYVALALHQAARVVGAAVGGQTLASAEAVEAAGRVDGVAVEPLGAFRLRDFDGPARLHRLTAPGLGALGAAVVRAVPADGHNLVMPLTSFVGREAERDDVRALLAERRIVTIAAPGGMGKTRLAIEVGVSVAPAWADGVWMVELAPLSDPHLVPSAIAHAVGVSAGGDDEWEATLEHLRDRSTLIILDNCEHLLAAAAAAALDLVTRCRGVGVLATSRELLGVRGEVVWRLPALPVVTDSLNLFVDRAQSIDPQLDVAAFDEIVVHEICAQLDGMPLAIELAAARAGVISLTEIRDGLRKGFKLLRTRDSTVPERQRTMRGLLDWSVALLAPDEKTALSRLAVFAGTFDVTSAAAAIAQGGTQDDEVPELVWSLADKSLVVVERATGASRYRLLDTVRAYAAELLEEAAEAESTRLALATWFLDRYPFPGDSTPDRLADFSLELESVVALIEPLLEDGRSEEAHFLAMLWADHQMNTRGHVRPTLALLRQVIGRSTRPTTGLARIHILAAGLAGTTGDGDAARTHLREADALVEVLGSEDACGRIPLARGHARQARRDGSPDALRRAVSLMRGELSIAPDASDRIDSMMMLAGLLNGLDDDEGVALMADIVDAARVRDDLSLLTAALSESAELWLRRGDVGAAAGYQKEALHLGLELGSQVLVSFSMIIAARIVEPRGDVVHAVQLHGAADVLLDEVGFQLLPDDREMSDSMLDHARGELGDQRFESETLAGRAMSLDDAIRLTDALLEQAIHDVAET